MARQPGFFDVEERLALLSAKGDGLERLAAVVDFEIFRPGLERAVPRAERGKGGRPPFDHVLMFKVLVLQTRNSLSDEWTEFCLRARLTWMRFLGLGLPRGADQGRCRRAAVRALQPGAPCGRLSRDGRPAGRCRRLGTQAAQHRGREGMGPLMGHGYTVGWPQAGMMSGRKPSGSSLVWSSQT